jgi:hypothetical protein
MHEKKIKDKRIRMIDFRYIAIVEYYNDTPDRDNDKQIEKMFATMEAAQIYLDQFPRDIWDGFDMDDRRYREIDERGKNERKNYNLFELL